MRTLIVVLVLLNALFFAWTRGWLDGVTGIPANGGREPQRLSRQVNPERIEPLDAKSATALTQHVCLELGPLDGDAALSAAQTALRGALPAGVESLTRTQEQAGVYVIATIKLDNADFRARKEATYKQMHIETQALDGLPAEQPALVLGRYPSQAVAQAELARFEARGLKGLRILGLQPAARQHSLVLREVDGLVANRLKALKDPALAAGFKACSAASAEAAASVPAPAASGASR